MRCINQLAQFNNFAIMILANRGFIVILTPLIEKNYLLIAWWRNYIFNNAGITDNAITSHSELKAQDTISFHHNLIGLA